MPKDVAVLLDRVRVLKIICKLTNDEATFEVFIRTCALVLKATKRLNQFWNVSRMRRSRSRELVSFWIMSQWPVNRVGEAFLI